MSTQFTPRPLKFRAWDDVQRKMIYDVRPIHGNAYAIVDKVTGTDRAEYVLFNGSVMQFTGLTDINGKEIWEGDLIKNQYNEIYQIGYTNQSFVAFNNGYMKLEWFGETSEVIGNIFENSVLLK